MNGNGYSYEQPWGKDTSFMRSYYEIKVCAVLDECTKNLSGDDMAALAHSLIRRLQTIALGKEQPTARSITKRMLDLVGEGKYHRTD